MPVGPVKRSDERADQRQHGAEQHAHDEAEREADEAQCREQQGADNGSRQGSQKRSPQGSGGAAETTHSKCAEHVVERLGRDREGQQDEQQPPGDTLPVRAGRIDQGAQEQHDSPRKAQQDGQ